MPRQDAQAQLENLIESVGLDHASRKLHEISRPAVRLASEAVELDDEPLGECRLGGLPDLPEELEWPTDRGRALSFLAQFRLSTLTPFDRRRLLPGRGHLWFFYDAEGQPQGQEPQDAESFRVLFHAGEQSELSRRKPPPGLSIPVFPAASVQLSTESSLPPEESHEAQVLDLSPEDWDLYYELLTGLEATESLGTEPRHKLLGYADPHQGDMRLDCQVIASGRSCREEGIFRSDDALALDQGISEWQLLLQLDSDPELGWNWEDAGRLYFMVRLDQLRQARFDKSWMVLQSPL